jgi:hypothetical protein
VSRRRSTPQMHRASVHSSLNHSCQLLWQDSTPGKGWRGRQIHRPASDLAIAGSVKIRFQRVFFESIHRNIDDVASPVHLTEPSRHFLERRIFGRRETLNNIFVFGAYENERDAIRSSKFMLRKTWGSLSTGSRSLHSVAVVNSKPSRQRQTAFNLDLDVIRDRFHPTQVGG